MMTRERATSVRSLTRTAFLGLPLLTMTLLSTGVAAQAPAAPAVPAIGSTVFVGAGIYEVAVSPSTGTVYVAAVGQGSGNAKVYVLDPETLATTRTIDVSENAAYGLGLNDRTQKLYTTNTRAGTGSVIDLATGTVTELRTPADSAAHLRQAVVDEEANVVYFSSYADNGAVWVVDGATNEIHVIQNVGEGSSGLALDKAANRLYVTNLEGNDISVIDLGTRSVVQRFAAGGERPTNAAFDPTRNRLFVANQTSGDVSVLDTRTGEVIKAIPTGAGALGVTYNPVNDKVYVGNRGAGSVTILDAGTLEVVTQLGVGSRPNTIAVNKQTGVAYVTKKAISGGRGAPPIADPNGDTVTLLRP
jgi:YVTN family beta-propeller protein